MGFILTRLGNGGNICCGIFSDRRKRTEEERDELEAELYQQIGQLKVENDWLKKNFSSLSCGEEAISGKG